MILSLLSLALGQSLAFRPMNGIALPRETAKFEFVVLGDNRPAGKGLPPTDVFKEIVREVAMIHPAFVLSSGDLVYGNEEPLSAYKTEFREILPVLKSLGVPFFNAPGNHEINNRTDFQREYISRFGPLYGAFDYGGWRFIAVSTDQARNVASIGTKQAADLQMELDSPEPKCVYLHRPIFMRETNDDKSDATVAEAQTLHQLFTSHNVKFVFEGHDHVFNHQSHDGIEYYISGGAGAPLDTTPDKGGFFHYMIVHVDGDQARVDVVPAGSLVVHGNVVSNYSDVDIDVNDLTMRLPRRPISASADVDAKGKMEKQLISIVKVERQGDAWLVHLSLNVKKAKNTIVSFRY